HLVAHARLPIIRGKSGLASFQQCCHSRPGHHSAIFCPRLADRKKWRSAFVAGVFAVHPLHVESVAWIAERKDVLSGLFFALTLAAYNLYSRRPNIVRYSCLALLFACGLMSKPMLVTLPFVLLLADFWPLRRFKNATAMIMGYRLSGWSLLLLEKIPLFALSAAACVVALLTQHPDRNAVNQLPLIWRLA